MIRRTGVNRNRLRQVSRSEAPPCVQWRARHYLGVSRNRLIVRALEQAIRERPSWAPEFLEKLRHVDEQRASAVDELLADVKRARRSKSPREL